MAESRNQDPLLFEELYGSGVHTSQKLTSTHDIDDDVKRLDLEEASYDTEATKSTPSPLEQELIDSVNRSLNMSSSEEFSQLTSKIEDEMTAYETKDVLVKVHKPEKVVKAMESFVQYSVSTKTTREDFEIEDYCVKRRYNDFLWLRDQLKQKNPLLMVAPLPEKHNMTLDRFDKEFIRFREVALNRFLTRISEHPIMSQEKCLHSFLTLETVMFSRMKKSTSGISNRMSQSLLNFSAGSYRNSIKLSYDHDSIYKYTEKFSSKMAALEHVTHRVTQQQNAYLQCITSCSRAYNQWAHNDSDLNSPLTSMCELFDETHINYLLLVDDAVLRVSLPYKEYHLFAEVIKSAMEQRDMIQYSVENISSSLDKVKEEQQSVGHASSGVAVTLANGERTSVGASVFGRPSPVQTHAKKASLQNRVQKMTADRESAGDKLEIANAVLQSDYQRWHVCKKHDLKAAISDMADKNIAFYDTQITYLETLLRKMRERKSCSDMPT